MKTIIFLSAFEWCIFALNLGFYLESNSEYKIINFIAAFFVLPFAIQMTYDGIKEN